MLWEYVGTLENASTGFIAKAIFHEVLRVFLGRSEQSDHNVMARKYIEPMAEALRSWYPELSQNDAEALSWIGLKGTPSWAGVPADKKAAYWALGDRHKNINNAYHHDYGHAYSN